jgi:predicted AlkP superfamily phosphohydrolase/phosphomutase
MKILVIGLDSAAPEILFGDERLTNFRRLMEFGCYGRLENTDLSAQSITICDQMGREGGNGVLICAPPSYFPSIGENARFVEDYPVGAPSLGLGEKDRIKDDLYALSRRQFDILRRALQDPEWDYLHFNGTALDNLHLAFGEDNNYEEVILDFYCYLDQEIEKVLEALSDDITILILSRYGVERARSQASSSPGCFILIAPNNPLNGEVEGAHILDIAPTLLELGGYDLPSATQGKSLVTGKILEPADMDLSEDDERAIRERLSGLGYIS